MPSPLHEFAIGRPESWIADIKFRPALTSKLEPSLNLSVGNSVPTRSNSS